MKFRGTRQENVRQKGFEMVVIGRDPLLSVCWYQIKFAQPHHPLKVPTFWYGMISAGTSARENVAVKVSGMIVKFSDAVVCNCVSTQFSGGCTAAIDQRTCLRVLPRKSIFRSLIFERFIITITAYVIITVAGVLLAHTPAEHFAEQWRCHAQSVQLLFTGGFISPRSTCWHHFFWFF